MALKRLCEACGAPYTAQRPSSRFCSDVCVKRAQRRAKVTTEDDDSEPLVVATEAELKALGLLDTRMGQQAVQLAVKVSSKFDTASAIAAASRELDRMMDKILASTVRASDPIDEMKAKRDGKRNSAAAG